MHTIPESALSAFLAAAHDASARGLLRCSSGNLSLRLDHERMLISCSRSWLGNLAREDLSIVRIADCALLHGKRPSVETGFHAGVLAARPDINVVLHFQSPCATILACRPPGTTNYNIIPEVPFYLGPIAEIPWHTPGTPELAAAVIAALRTHDLVNLNHHGQVTAAPDLPHAIQNADFFELAAHTLVHGGPTLQPLTPEAIQTLLDLRQQSRGV
jgi:ribulose-5-phosphate 4-epimerase/fuculose-1-phosphate aldolase